MVQINKLKLFISYSHQDNLADISSATSYIEQFRNHITPLKDNGLIEDWHDRKIFPGDDYQSKINNNLDDADIICLFVSANFLSSKNCMNEKRKALELREKKGVPVIPIILSHCGWLDNKYLSKLLALPTDGKPISGFQNRDEAWLDAYNGLKRIIEKEIQIRQLKFTEQFENFLQDAEMLAKSHSRKERVLIDDIYVYPELKKYDEIREHKGKINSQELLKNLLDYSKIVIAGEDQAGKTALCKIIFKELRNKNFIPAYISDRKTYFSGKIENKIFHSLHEQYENININEFDKERVIPIVDDFHLAKNKEKHIEDLSVYPRCIVIVDDIFGLNIRDDKLIRLFTYFEIKEFKPSLRYELIKKWITLPGKEPEIYKDVDKNIELINSILGKTIGKGIMPAYPFFILSAIVAYETFAMPLDQEITSQGYCYQAFIFFYLKKQGVRNDEIDIYINFLTELAFYIYRESKYELTPDGFASFMKLYLQKYTLPIKQEILLKNLSPIISVDSFNNYSFRYPYLYFFFVAKYLADHLEHIEIKKEIEKIINNLHVDENAYIAVFITHHSKNINILEEIELNALCLFDKYKPATLSKHEVKFFDKQADIIVKAVLPPINTTPEKERMERLRVQDKIEESEKDLEQKGNSDKEDSLEIELRRAIKTVEVMGCITKNRAGSLEKNKLENIFVAAMNVHLRILSSFFEIIKSEDEQKSIIDFILENLKKIVEKNERELSENELKEHAKTIFWNLNFFVVFGIVHKIVHSLGSDKLTEIVKKACNEINTPASFLVKQGILMGYNKNLHISELTKRIGEKDFSEIAKRAIKLMVVNHCSLHPINYKDRQRIETQLGIPPKKLLTPRS